MSLAPSVSAGRLPITVRHSPGRGWRADLCTHALIGRGRTLAGAIGRLLRTLADQEERSEPNVQVRVELSPAVVSDLLRIAALRHLPPGRRSQLISDLCRAHGFPVVDATWILEALASETPPLLAMAPSPAE